MHAHPQLTRSALLCSVVLAAASNAWAADTAQTRYEADLKLCADETAAEARLQCRRDARAIYDKAMKTPAAAAPAAAPAPAAKASTANAGPCMVCAKVTSIARVEKAGEANTAGMVAGGLAGALLGRQVGGGFGKDLSTIAGAAGGAYAGKKIQENMNKSTVWRVSVAYDDGRTGQFDFAQDPGFSVGDAVRQEGTTLVRP
jgi:uncharacterized protein YcfJ